MAQHRAGKKERTLQDTLVALDSVAHRALRIHKLGGTHPHFVPVILAEVERAAACCPLFLSKDPETGRFALAALFGFEDGEVLVEGANEGNAAFIPFHVQRQGFFASGEAIAIDMAHPRLAAGGTVPLFDPSGEPSDALRTIQRAIGAMVQHVPPTDAFVEALVQLRLIETVDITLTFDDGQRLSLDGLYTVSADALAALDDDEIIRLFRKGWLQAAVVIQASLQNLAVLARRRNERLAGN